jgi:hypothetical protein
MNIRQTCQRFVRRIYRYRRMTIKHQFVIVVPDYPEPCFIPDPAPVFF